MKAKRCCRERNGRQQDAEGEAKWPSRTLTAAYRGGQRPPRICVLLAAHVGGFTAYVSAFFDVISILQLMMTIKLF